MTPPASGEISLGNATGDTTTFNSWVLNEQQCLWYPPIAYPTDNNTYEWDETSISWKKIN